MTMSRGETEIARLLRVLGLTKPSPADDPPPPDLTLLFKAQARLAGVPESAIHATAGYYRAIAPSLNIEQLHQLALLFNDEFEAGVAVGEGARRHQEGE
jgi:hypothetical protein